MKHLAMKQVAIWSILGTVKPSLFVRPITREEHQVLEKGSYSAGSAFQLHCQILLASEQGESPLAIARRLGCSDVTVRNVINAFNQMGLAALRKEKG